MGTNEPNQGRPRRGTRTFSFRSDKSNKSAAPRLHESAAEKESHRLHTKADPSMAMNEAEPSAVQATERSSLAPLRAIQHKDVFGNPIAEPDKSNPTRSRWERPLDTIRSFEAAIEGPYYPRRQATRPDSEADWNKRGSYYSSRNYAPSRAPSVYSNANGSRYPVDNYYGSRPTSHFENRPSPPARDSYHEAHQYGSYGPHGGGYAGYGPANGMQYQNRQRAMRMPSEPQLNYNRREPNGVYPPQHRDRSYETVASATGSGSGVSGDQGSYRTDPSSDNSSFDRASPPKPSPPLNDYGIGFSAPLSYQPPAFAVGANNTPSSYQPQSSYQPPSSHEPPSSYQQPAFAVGANRPPTTIHKKPVPGTLGSNLPPSVPRKDNLPSHPPLAQPPKPATEKRKSWLFRRFSRT